MPFQKGHKINIGRKYSKERNMKISKSSIGNTNALGFKHSEEAKRKISESHKGLPVWNKGKHHSNETRKKISKAVKN